jgi:hypothetical protein
MYEGIVEKCCHRRKLVTLVRPASYPSRSEWTYSGKPVDVNFVTVEVDVCCFLCKIASACGFLGQDAVMQVSVVFCNMWLP